MNKSLLLSVLVLSTALSACGSTTDSPESANPAGTISLVITDGPMEMAQEVIFHLTHVDMGLADGSVVRMQLHAGAHDVDMMQLQNGLTHMLLDGAELPAGHYEWMELGLDLQQSHFGSQSGGHHGMVLGEETPLRVHAPFEIGDGQHMDFVMDFDLGLGIRQHQMGGMMGTQYQLHNGLHLMNAAEVGGLIGVVDSSLVDVNHPDCDPAEGGNRAYLFDATNDQPDDLAVTDTDGIAGPVATDIVELHLGQGEYLYHFGHVPAGAYRVGFSCSAEWDEEGDDDYPVDPDGRFDFQAFSDVVDVVAGQVQVLDLIP